jgi:transcriptional regulator with XRE-family HTH domain
VKKSSIKHDFGLKVKQLRIGKGLTQADLAAEIDIDIRTISRIETGKHNASLDVIIGLANAFKVGVADLFK